MEDPPIYRCEYHQKGTTLRETSQFNLGQWRWPAEEDEFYLLTDGTKVIHAAPSSWSTYIAALLADPYGGYTAGTQQVAMLLTTGQPLLFPLTPLEKPLSFLPSGETVWWESGHSAQWLCSSVSELFAELVVSTLEDLQRYLPEETDAGQTVGLTAMEGEEEEDGTNDANRQVKRKTARRSSMVKRKTRNAPTGTGVIHTSLLHSVPYKVSYRSRFRNQLILSMSCEESLLSLSVPSADSGGSRTNTTNDEGTVKKSLIVTKRFQLPRGVIPLDMSEIVEYETIAVGTYEHGVLLCDVARDGGVISILRSVSLSFSGSMVFPAMYVAALFPETTPSKKTKTRKRIRGNESENEQESPKPSFAWRQEAERLSALTKGALVCASPFDSSSVVVKLSGPGIYDFSNSSPSLTLKSPSFRFSSAAVWSATSFRTILTLNIFTDKQRVESGRCVYSCVMGGEPIVDFVPNGFRAGVTVAALDEGAPVWLASNYDRKQDRSWLPLVDSNNVVFLLVAAPPSSISFEKNKLKLRRRGAPVVHSEIKKEEGEKGSTKEVVFSSDGGTVPSRDVSTGIAVIEAQDNLLKVAVTHHVNCISILTFKDL